MGKSPETSAHQQSPAGFFEASMSFRGFRLSPVLRKYSFIHGKAVDYSLNRVKGLMLGIAIGDALGLPAEILTREQIIETFGFLSTYQPLETNRFFRGLGAKPGEISDDFLLSHSIVESIIRCGGLNMEDIGRSHLKALREFPAGFGKTTIDALLRFASGISWRYSGIPASPKYGCGNGIPMKTGPLAVYHALQGSSREETIKSLIDLCALTHATPMSAAAGLAQLWGTIYCLGVEPSQFSREKFCAIITEAGEVGSGFFRPSLVNDDIRVRFAALKDSGTKTHDEIIQEFGKGSCYVYDSLPFTLAFFLKDPFSIRSLFDVVNAGGDTDTNGAMLGALLGALNGRGVFPRHLVKGVSARKTALMDASALWRQALESKGTSLQDCNIAR